MERQTLTLTPGEIRKGELILVNAQHPFQEAPDTPAPVPACADVPAVLLAPAAAAALNALMDALGGGWRQITPVSGWRSRQEQQAIYTQSLRDSGEAFTRQFVALPGCSEHQTGLAVDLAETRAVIDFICPDFPDTGLCGAFRAQAAAHGFVERYPRGKEAVTGIAHEPWHFRYVGRPHAELMRRHDLTLEEYVDWLRAFPPRRPCQCRDTGGRPCAVFYQPVGERPVTLPAEPGAAYRISGNNVDGCIVTQGWQA